MSAARLILTTGTSIGGRQLEEAYVGPGPAVLSALGSESQDDLLLAQLNLERGALSRTLADRTDRWFALQHPFIRRTTSIQVFEPNLLVAVSPAAEGVRLLDLVQRDGPLSAASALRIAVQVASAVSHAASAGVTPTGLGPELVRVSGVLGGGGEVARVSFLGLAGFVKNTLAPQSELADVRALGRLIRFMLGGDRCDGEGIEAALALLAVRCLAAEPGLASALEVELRLRLLEHRWPPLVPTRGPAPPARWVLDDMRDISEEAVYGDTGALAAAPS